MASARFAIILLIVAKVSEAQFDMGSFGNFGNFGGFGSSPSSPSSPSGGSPNRSPTGFSTFGGFNSPSSGFPFNQNSNTQPAPSPALTGNTGVSTRDSGRNAQSGGQSAISAGAQQGAQTNSRTRPDGSQDENTNTQPMRFTFGGNAFSKPGAGGGSGTFPQFSGSFNFFGNNNSPFNSGGAGAPAPAPTAPTSFTRDRDRAPQNRVPSPPAQTNGNTNNQAPAAPAPNFSFNPFGSSGSPFGGSFGGFNRAPAPAPPAGNNNNGNNTPSPAPSSGFPSFGFGNNNGNSIFNGGSLFGNNGFGNFATTLRPSPSTSAGSVSLPATTGSGPETLKPHGRSDDTENTVNTDADPRRAGADTTPRRRRLRTTTFAPNRQN